MSSASSPSVSMQGIEKARVAVRNQRELRNEVFWRRRAVRLITDRTVLFRCVWLDASRIPPMCVGPSAFSSPDASFQSIAV